MYCLSIKQSLEETIALEMTLVLNIVVRLHLGDTRIHKREFQSRGR